MRSFPKYGTAVSSDKMNKRRVLICNMGDQWLRGQEIVILDLLDHIDRTRFDVVLWSNNPLLCREAGRRGFESQCDEFELFFQWSSRRFSPSRYGRLVKAARQLIRRHAIDIVHANGAGPCQWLVPASRSLGKPVVAHIHITYLKRNRLVLGACFANRVVGVSRAAVEPFLSDGVAPERAAVVHNGINTALLSQIARPPAALTGDDAKPGTIIMAGSLVARKGYDVGIRAVRRLVERGVPVQALVAGAGEDRRQLETQAEGLPIRFLGELDRAEILGLFQAVPGIMLLPSQAEGLPLSILEAATFGVPTVASPVGGIPEFIDDGVNGFLCAGTDVEAFAARLHELVVDEPRRRMVGEAARATVQDRFTAAHMAQALERLYVQAMEQPRWLSMPGHLSHLFRWRASTQT